MKTVIKMSGESYDAPKLTIASVRAERGFTGSIEMPGMLDGLYETNGTWD